MRNEDRVLDAAVEVLGESGWAGLTIAAVSRAAGLSSRAVHDRFADRSELAAAAWRHRCGPYLLDAMAEVLRAAGQVPADPSQPAPPAIQPIRAMQLAARWDHVSVAWPSPTWDTITDALASEVAARDATADGDDAVGSAFTRVTEAVSAVVASVEQARSASAALEFERLRQVGPSAPWLDAALDAFARPGVPMKAAVELLISSQFDSALAQAVEEHCSVRVKEWCTPHRKSPTAQVAAQRAYLICVMLGYVLVHQRPGAEQLDLRPQTSEIFDVLLAPSEPTRLPSDRAEYLDERVPFDTGDAALDALLQATLTEIAARGFDRTTTLDIARAAGCSEGLIFGRYDSKLELFLDASRRQQALALRLYNDFQASARAAHGMGIADALAIREVQRPEIRLQRATYLEQIRLSWHDEGLRVALEAEFEQFADDAVESDPTWTPAVSDEALHFSLALGQGLALLPVLDPAVWKLPYDVLTIPMAQD